MHALACSDALLTCALLSNCVAVQCLPAANFVDVPDRIGLDASGVAIGASEATLGLWRASAAGGPAGVARELARGAGGCPSGLRWTKSRGFLRTLLDEFLSSRPAGRV